MVPSSMALPLMSANRSASHIFFLVIQVYGDLIAVGVVPCAPTRWLASSSALESFSGREGDQGMILDLNHAIRWKLSYLRSPVPDYPIPNTCSHGPKNSCLRDFLAVH
jgi:hypothetical protein